MGKRKNRIPNYNPNPPAPKAQMITSILDHMREGEEYSSIIGLQNVNVDARTELLRSISEISNIRQRPLLCYISNVVNSRITQSISIDSSDDAPFLEALRSIPDGEKSLILFLLRLAVQLKQ